MILTIHEHRVEARADSPDPSVPLSGRLIGAAQHVAEVDRWATSYRAGDDWRGIPSMYATRKEAILALIDALT